MHTSLDGPPIPSLPYARNLSLADLDADVEKKADTPTPFSPVLPVADHDVSIDTAEDKAAIKQQFTYKDEKRILRKVGLYILPILILAYLNKNLNVNIIDVDKPSNILTELNMTSDDYAWTSTVYTIPFILFGTSNVLFNIQGPKQLFLRICFLWSPVAALHAAVKNKAGLLTTRFFLSVFEAGLFPAIYTHFTYWCRPDEMAVRVCAVGLLGSFSGILSALISYGIDQIRHSSISPWRILFIAEGASGFLICVAIYLWLPNYPDTAPFLTPSECLFVQARLPPNGNRAATSEKFDKTQIIDALRDPRTYAFTGVQIFGFTTTQSSQLLNIPPAAVGIVVALTFAWVSDRTFGVPRPLYLIPSKFPALYALIIIATARANVLSSVLFSWRAQTYKGATSAAFILAFQNGLSQLSGVISPQIFRSKYAPRYTVPYIVSLVFLAVSVVSTFWAWYLTHFPSPSSPNPPLKMANADLPIISSLSLADEPASISSLPSELIDEILSQFFSEDDVDVDSLKAASLVCRAWREPAQRFVWASGAELRNEQDVQRYIKSASRRRSGPKELAVHGFKDAASLKKLFEVCGGLRWLMIATPDRDFKSELLASPALSDLKTLIVQGWVVAPPASTKFPFSLHTLVVDDLSLRRSQLAPFLTSLEPTCIPSLRSLSLPGFSSAAHPAIASSLMPFAPHLKHFGLSIALRDDASPYIPFVEAATALHSLECISLPSDLLLNLPKNLAVLATKEDAVNLSSETLAQAFERLPNLKRLYFALSRAVFVSQVRGGSKLLSDMAERGVDWRFMGEERD
ncbi:hypothetical protein JCM8547_006108 [Rhodosporidiobolus lusitaniae]